MAFSSDNRWLATASGGAAPNQGAVWLWDLKAGDPAATPIVLSVRGSTVRALSTSGDGRWLVAVGDDRLVRLWDLKADDPASHPHVLDGQSDSHLTAAFSADNRWLATGGGDQQVRLWRIGKSGPEKTPIVLQAGQGPIDSLAISPDGHWLITAGDDQTARLWNLRLDELTQFALGTAGAKVSTIGISPTESMISDRTQVADRQLQLGSPKDEAKLYR
jgi:WD40 repeat protein